MKKILCPTDFSDRSLTTYRLASRIAMSMSADLILYHASVDVEDLSDNDPLWINNLSGIPPSLEVENKKILETWQQLKNSESQDGKKARFDFIMEEGYPLASITRFVAKNDIDLIVMHTKSDHRQHYEGVYIGSVGAQVVEEVKCPVLLVPHGVAHESIKRMLYAVDLDCYSIDSIREADRFAESFNAKTIYLYLGDPRQEKINDFKKRVEEALDKKIEIETRQAEDFVEGLNAIVIERETNLLIMERHRRNILEKLFSKSLLKAMEKYAEIPLLIMHVHD